MSELLRVLAEEDVDDETLTEAANAAFAVLEARDVDVEGVAPVLNQDAGEAGQEAIDEALRGDGPETTLVLSPVTGPARRLRIRETDQPGAPYVLEEDVWTGCAWRPIGREELERVELDGEEYEGTGEVLSGP